MATVLETSHYVPYARRRNTPAQLSALQRLFETTPHPSRAQRQALANEIGMELKSVTNWFQNRRQVSRKKLPSNENDPPRTRLPPSPAHRQHKRPAEMPLDRSKISLDRIATLSERPSLTFQSNTQRLPLTPRKSNARQKNKSSPLGLWTHMLSSPAVPPFSPDPEGARLAALSSRAKILCPLEWACLKARQKKWVDEDADGLPAHRALGQCKEVCVGEAASKIIARDSAVAVAPWIDASDQNRKNSLSSRPNTTPQFEEVEAAITLLGFKTRSK